MRRTRRIGLVLAISDREAGQMKSNKAIAHRIALAYRDGEYSLIDNNRRVEFYVDGLTVRCRNTREAVASVCLKYNKALKKWQKPAPLPSKKRLGVAVR